MTGGDAFARLLEALRCLPGVGPKSAQRMALHLLQRDRSGAAELTAALAHALEVVGQCQDCRGLSEARQCSLCADARRDRSQLCVVEGLADQLSIERSADYRGTYFVLAGRLSPLDGIGPEELGLDHLAARLDAGEVAEVILAMGTTLEGEATAHYVAEMARRRGIKATRIAYGVPLGGELDYVDGSTLSHALAARRDYVD
jgi:recombination protein RecR